MEVRQTMYFWVSRRTCGSSGLYQQPRVLGSLKVSQKACSVFLCILGTRSNRAVEALDIMPSEFEELKHERKSTTSYYSCGFDLAREDLRI